MQFRPQMPGPSSVIPQSHPQTLAARSAHPQTRQQPPATTSAPSPISTTTQCSTLSRSVECPASPCIDHCVIAFEPASFCCVIRSNAGHSDNPLRRDLHNWTPRIRHPQSLPQHHPHLECMLHLPNFAWATSQCQPIQWFNREKHAGTNS